MVVTAVAPTLRADAVGAGVVAVTARCDDVVSLAEVVAARAVAEDDGRSIAEHRRRIDGEQ